MAFQKIKIISHNKLKRALDIITLKDSIKSRCQNV